MSGRLGRGIAFPLRLDADGRVAWSVDEANIAEHLRLILSTDPGERLRRPMWGGGLRSFAFQPNATATHRLIAERVRRAVDAHEPRVALQAVEVDAHPHDPHVAVVTITYAVRATAEVGRVRVDAPVGG